MTDAERRMLRELQDRGEVRDVVLRYARGVDRRDLTLVASCFTRDASYQGTLSCTDIGDALVTLERSLARYERTFHFIGNQWVELAGDEAACESYAIAYHRSTGPSGTADLVVAVLYHDQMVRADGAWRIRHRRAETVWTRRDPVVGDPGQPPAAGRHPAGK